MTVQRRTEIHVESNGNGNPKTLKDLKQFVKEAYENGFTDKDQPWCGSALIWSLSISRQAKG